MTFGRYHSIWEYMLPMTRFTVSVSALLLSCCVVSAQAPSKPASPQMAVETTQSAEVQQFQKIEDSWSDSVNRHDQYSLELVLSPLFVDVAATGDITTRNQQLVQVMAGEDKTVWLVQKVITVRMLGDIAVANGTYTLHHRLNTAEVDKRVSLPMCSNGFAAVGSASTHSGLHCEKTRMPTPSPGNLRARTCHSTFRCSPRATRVPISRSTRDNKS